MWDGDIIERNGKKYEVSMSFLSSQKGVESVHFLRSTQDKDDCYALHRKTDGTETMKRPGDR